MTDIFALLGAALVDRYRIERELGQGGMATVYLAHDVKHGRKVAIKVLRPELAAVIGIERFLREIRTIATLQHPHILGLIDSGEVQGTAYYVMPFVAGESLRDRLTREKQLSIPDAVRITSEVAAALDYAHRHGVIHRDIKPENILLHDGQALVADFGIALAVTSAGGSRMTETGLSLGTPGYMSPEQATGDRQLDARSDVYSLGCMLYEMLAGEPPHTGPTVQAVIAAVVTKDPEPIASRRSTVPPNVADAVHQALAKLPADRFETAAAFAHALRDPSFTTRALFTTGSIRRANHPGVLVGLGIAALAVGVVGGWQMRRPTAATHTPLRFYLGSDTTREIQEEFGISPDGTRLVYLARTATGDMLFQQRLDALDPQPIPGTGGAVGTIFFSPDGNWVGFATDRALRKVRLDGSDPITVTTIDEGLTGATWGSDGSIYFSTFPSGRFFRLSAQGGNPIPIVVHAAVGKPFVTSPVLLPGGTALLCVDYQAGNRSRIGVLDLRSGDFKPVMVGISAHFLAPGYLLYGTFDGSLMLQPFDPNRPDTTGPARQLVENVSSFIDASIRYDVSAAGALVYQPRAGSGAVLQLMRREGTTHVLSIGSRFWVPHFSPDGRRIVYGAYTESAGAADLWMYDLAVNTDQRLTSGGQSGRDYNDPVWSPDGRQIALSARDSGSGAVPGKHLYLMPSDASAPPAHFLSLPGDQWPSDWTRDGKSLLFTHTPPAAKRAIWIVPVSRGAAATPVVSTAYNALGGRLSPDGRWLAFESDETGQSEVYIQPFPGPGTRVRVSVSGGQMPAWSRTGKELFYWERAELIAVELRLGAQIALGTHTELFKENLQTGGVLAQYDPDPDGRRFVVAALPGASSRLAVISNVLAELAR